MTLKDQKEALLKQIDKEINKAAGIAPIYLKIPKERKFYSEKFWEGHFKSQGLLSGSGKERVKKEKTQVNFEKTESVVFRTDSGLQYTIIKSKASLAKFKKIIKSSFPVSNKKSIKKPYTLDMLPKGIRPTLNVGQYGNELDFEYIKPYKPCKVSNKNFRLLTATTTSVEDGSHKKLRQYENWFSNGHYMIRGKLPDNLDKAIGKNREPILKEHFNSIVDSREFEPAEIKVEVHKSGASVYLVLIQIKDIKITLNTEYVDLIMKYYPKALPFVSPQNTEKVLFKHDGEVVAICIRCGF